MKLLFRITSYNVCYTKLLRMTSFDMVRALRQNVPVKVAFNNQETLGKLAQRLATQLEPDSLALVQAFTAPA